MLFLLASQAGRAGSCSSHLLRRAPASEETQVNRSPNHRPAEEGRGPQPSQTLGSEMDVFGAGESKLTLTVFWG